MRRAYLCAWRHDPPVPVTGIRYWNGSILLDYHAAHDGKGTCLSFGHAPDHRPVGTVDPRTPCPVAFIPDVTAHMRSIGLRLPEAAGMKDVDALRTGPPKPSGKHGGAVVA